MQRAGTFAHRLPERSPSRLQQFFAQGITGVVPNKSESFAARRPRVCGRKPQCTQIFHQPAPGHLRSNLRSMQVDKRKPGLCPVVFQICRIEQEVTDIEVSVIDARAVHHGDQPGERLNQRQPLRKRRWLA